MRLAAFIAFRYLFSRRKQAFVSLISIMSILGVALGVIALLVSTGLLTGFAKELQDKILGVNAHGLVASYNGIVFNTDKLLEEVKKDPEIIGATPFIYSETMLSTPAGAKGVFLRGIDPSTALDVVEILKPLGPATLVKLDPPEGSGDTPGIIVGKELAQKLNLEIGSRVSMLAPSGQKTAAGYSPKIKPFVVVGIFKVGMVDFDSSLAFIGNDSARNLLGLGPNMSSGIEVAVTDVSKANIIMKSLLDNLHKGDSLATKSLYTRDWKEMHLSFFAAIQLEKIVAFFVVALITFVASFSIISTLIMMVMEKVRDIAILMSMGVTRKTIRNIFIMQGMIIGAVGTTLGTVCGLAICYFIHQYQFIIEKFIEIPKGVYPDDKIPMLLQPMDVVLVVICALLICFSATIYPSYKASGLEVADALRYE